MKLENGDEIEIEIAISQRRWAQICVRRKINLLKWYSTHFGSTYDHPFLLLFPFVCKTTEYTAAFFFFNLMNQLE